MFSSGTLVTQVTASDADDPSSGNNARLVYSLLQGQPYFSIEPTTGIPGWNNMQFNMILSWQTSEQKFPAYKCVVKWTKCFHKEGGCNVILSI